MCEHDGRYWRCRITRRMYGLEPKRKQNEIKKRYRCCHSDWRRLKQEESLRRMEASVQRTLIYFPKQLQSVGSPVYLLESSCCFNYTALATGQVALTRQINCCEAFWPRSALSRTCQVSISRNYSRSKQAGLHAAKRLTLLPSLAEVTV
jgi:hypothetical protein